MRTKSGAETAPARPVRSGRGHLYRTHLRPHVQAALERMPPVVVEHARYRGVHGRLPNLLFPRYLSEHLVRRKLFDRDPRLSDLSDKHKVRRYVRDSVGEEVLVPLLMASTEPQRLFSLEEWKNTVIKPNHGALMVEILTEEPSPADKARIVARAETWLHTDFSHRFNERHYARIEPMILVEEFVGEGSRVPADCKVHCFRPRGGGFVPFVQLVLDRFGDKRMCFAMAESDRARLGELPQGTVSSLDELPAAVDEAIELSRRLSEGLGYVRVDWLLASERPYFSELTFTPGAGLSPTFGPDLDRALGALWR